MGTRQDLLGLHTFILWKGTQYVKQNMLKAKECLSCLLASDTPQSPSYFLLSIGLGVTFGSFDLDTGRTSAGQAEVVECLFMSVSLRTVPPSWSLWMPPVLACVLCVLFVLSGNLQ